MDASTYASGCLLELLRGEPRKDEGKQEPKKVIKLGNLKPGQIVKGPNNLTIRMETTRDMRVGKYNKDGLTAKGRRMMKAYYEEWLREQEFKEENKKAHEKLTEYLEVTDNQEEVNERES